MITLFLLPVILFIWIGMIVYCKEEGTDLSLINHFIMAFLTAFIISMIVLPGRGYP